MANDTGLGNRILIRRKGIKVDLGDIIFEKDDIKVNINFQNSTKEMQRYSVCVVAYTVNDYIYDKTEVKLSTPQNAGKRNDTYTMHIHEMTKAPYRDINMFEIHVNQIDSFAQVVAEGNTIQINCDTRSGRYTIQSSRETYQEQNFDVSSSSEVQNGEVIDEPDDDTLDDLDMSFFSRSEYEIPELEDSNGILCSPD